MPPGDAPAQGPLPPMRLRPPRHARPLPGVRHGGWASLTAPDVLRSHRFPRRPQEAVEMPRCSVTRSSFAPARAASFLLLIVACTPSASAASTDAGGVVD